MGHMIEAVFLDRDGVINIDNSPIKKKDIVIIDGSIEAIKKLNKAKIMCIIVTNQPWAAKGFCTIKDIEKMNAHLIRNLEKNGAHIEDIFYCPHHPEKGFLGERKELKVECGCRKPKPGMLIAAAKKHNLNLSKCFMIGDMASDVEAGHNAGCKTVLIGEHKKMIPSPDYVCPTLLKAVELII